MKNQSIAALTILSSFFCISISAQQTRFYSDPEEKFKEAKEYYQKEQYSLAYPLLKELQQSIHETDKANHVTMVQEINYYTIACALKQNEGRAEEMAKNYIDIEKNNARVQQLNFHLGEYYYRQQKFADAAQRYEQANISNLSNREIADMKFHQGYAYFTLQRFNEAKPLFNSIRQIKDDPNYIAANYYYGFLAFRDKNYNEALASFKIVENEKNYETIVPYYIAQIYYIQGKKEDAIAYTGQKLKARNAFLFCASNSSSPELKEVSKYNYAKLSYELGYQDEALNSLQSFLSDYPNSTYNKEAKELLVSVLANTSNYADALNLLQTLDKPSDNAKKLYPRILFGRATEFINDGRLAEADALLDKALKDPANASVLPYINFWKGEIAYRSN